MKTLLKTGSFAFLLCLFGLSAQFDFEDQVLQHNRACQMIADGAWENYDNIECETDYGRA